MTGVIIVGAIFSRVHIRAVAVAGAAGTSNEDSSEYITAMDSTPVRPKRAFREAEKSHEALAE